MKRLDYNKFLKKIGIYCIKNIQNDKMYIGSTVNLYKRTCWHISALRRNVHHNYYLQNSYNKYGVDNFELIILKECSKEDLRNLESYYIKFYNTLSSENGYNLTIVTKEKLFQSEESRKRQSEKMKGRKPIKALNRIKEMIDEGNNPYLGRIISEESIRKSKITKANWTEEQKKQYSKKLSTSLKKRGTNYQEKKTVCKNREGEVLKVYDKAKDILNDYPNLSYSMVLRICQGNRKEKFVNDLTFEYFK